MFAGHVGAALAIARAERRVNVGVFVAAALLADLLLWAFVLLGWESVAIPGDFAVRHQAQFVFPYSHGLLASLAWAALAGACFWRGHGPRAAALVAAAVFSHWLLDALVHRPELPLAGAGSALVGLGLWDRLPVALLVEAACVLAGLLLFVPGCGLARGRAWTLVALTLLILAFTVIGMTASPPPPSGFAMAASSLATLAVVCGLMLWLGRMS